MKKFLAILAVLSLITTPAMAQRYYHRGYYHHNDVNPFIIPAIIGGAIIGSALVYNGVRYNDAVSYCRARYRSYDPYTQTFLGVDGFRHPCP